MEIDQRLLNNCFMLDDYIVDASDNTIGTASQVRHVEPKAMQVLLVLASNPGKTVERQALFQQVWADRVVVEEVLTRSISQLRNALGDSQTRAVIKTIPKKGYRLNADVRIDSQRSDTLIDLQQQKQPIVFDNTRQSAHDVEQYRFAEFKRKVTKSQWLFALLIMAVVVTTLSLWTGSNTTDKDLNVPVSVAFLPLNAADGREQTLYIAQGIPEETMAVLSHIKRIRVPSSYSTYAQAQRLKRPQAIADALDVTYLLEGSVRAEGDNYRLVLRLIDAQNDDTVWSKTYLQNENELSQAARLIANDLVVKLLPNTPQQPPLAAQELTNNAGAYQSYLKGVYWLMNGKTSEWFYAAEEAFLTAIEADPTYAPAHGKLAYIYARYNYHDTYMRSDTALKKASEAIRTALSFDPNEINAHFAQAILYTSGYEFGRAEKSLKGVLQKDPSNATALYLMSELRLAENKLDEAMAFAQEAKNSDPLSPWINVNQAIIHFWRSEYDEALTAANNAIRIDQDYTWAYVWKAKVLHKQGRIAEAIAAMHRCIEIDDSSPVNSAYLGLLYLELGLAELSEPHFMAAASQYGDSADARFWKGFVRLAYENQDIEITLSLMKQLKSLNNRIFSLLPLFTYLATAQQDMGSNQAFLNSRYSQFVNRRPLVNHVNLHIASALTLLDAQDDNRSPPKSTPEIYRWLYWRVKKNPPMASFGSLNENSWLINYWLVQAMVNSSENDLSETLTQRLQRVEIRAHEERGKLSEQ